MRRRRVHAGCPVAAKNPPPSPGVELAAPTARHCAPVREMARPRKRSSCSSRLHPHELFLWIGRLRGGPRGLRGLGDPRRERALGGARVHRRPHAPRVVEAARRRVRPARAAARHDRCRGGPARDRERARHGRRPLAARRVRPAAARRLLHGLFVGAGIRLRVAAPGADAGRPRGTAAPPARDRSRRDDALPRCRLGLGARAREASARPARRRTRARRPR